MGFLSSVFGGRSVQERQLARFLAKYLPHPHRDFKRLAKSKKSLSEVWQACPRSDWMLWMLDCIEFKPATGLRLFACYCAKQSPIVESDLRLVKVIQVAERFAKGEAEPAELMRAQQDAYAVLAEAKRKNDPLAEAAAWVATSTAKEDPYTAAYDAGIYAVTISELRGFAGKELRRKQADRLRRIIEDPFAPNEED
ncbi:MAG: hypothetical protein ACR2IE_02365 [Candidatus Sumerlaeaceae bacterium]